LRIVKLHSGCCQARPPPYAGDSSGHQPFQLGLSTSTRSNWTALYSQLLEPMDTNQPWTPSFRERASSRASPFLSQSEHIIQQSRNILRYYSSLSIIIARRGSRRCFPPRASHAGPVDQRRCALGADPNQGISSMTEPVSSYSFWD
jgi:hypothetical protein